MEIIGDEDRHQAKNKGWWYHFKQQTLSAWTPRYNSTSVSPLMIGYGIFLIPIGIVVLIITTDGESDIKEFKVDYTHCINVQNSSMTCAQYLESRLMGMKSDDNEVCQCVVDFELPKAMKGEKIHMYYSLDNFYQNERKYAKSRDDQQLLGKIVTNGKPNTPNKDCSPLDIDKESGKIIFPCGAVANSMFNDSLQLYFVDDIQGEVKIQQIRRGIAWSSDLDYRYKNPPEFNARNDSIWEKFTMPKDWSRTIWDLDPHDPDNNGIQNEDFVVWMRISAFSNFQKLYRIIKTSEQEILGNRLPAGKYHLKVNYTYEVLSFKGKKGIVLSAPTVFGQQNLVQGIAAVSVGGLSVILGLLFFLCGCSNRHGKGYARLRVDGDSFRTTRRRRARSIFHLNNFWFLSAFKIIIFILVSSVITVLILLYDR